MTRPRSGFIDDLASRLTHRVQLTTDGHKRYLEAIEPALGSEVDYPTLYKVYGFPIELHTRYSPAQCIGCEVRVRSGQPDSRHISTSFVKRQNCTVRTNNSRHTRLSNGFSRKLEHGAASVMLNYFAYNFIKIHQTLRMSPAMAAGVTDSLFEVSDLVALWEEYERAAA